MKRDPDNAGKRRKGRKPGQPALMSFRDKLTVWAWIVGILTVVLSIVHYSTTAFTARHLDQTINRWRIDFHLSAEQAERVRAIERKFHGSGDPFTLPSHTVDEVRAHHEEVAAAMNPADGARFLETQQGQRNH